MQGNSAHAVALAVVVLLNFIIGHISKDWALPPDVQSSAQTLVAVIYGWWMKRQFTNPSTGSGSSSGAPSSADQATKT
jgi:uncharacterized membrane-anchored protein